MPYAAPNSGLTARDLKTPIGEKLGREKKPAKKELTKHEPEDDLFLKMAELQKEMARISEEVLSRKRGN